MLWYLGLNLSTLIKYGMIYCMWKSDKILAYEEISREIDFFSWEVWENIDNYKTRIAYILEHSDQTDALVQEIQWIKVDLFWVWELQIFKSVIQELWIDVIHQHAANFLGLLDEIIEWYLEKNGIESPRSFLLINTWDINPQNFDKILEDTTKNYGDTGVIIFLRECVSEWKVLPQIFDYAGERCRVECKNTDGFAYWEYRNLIKLTKTQIRLQESSTIGYDHVSVSLSGGNMNGISQVGIIEGILEAGKNISCISGTSIGALIGVIAGKVLDPSISPNENLKRWQEITEKFLHGIDWLQLQWNILSTKGWESLMSFFLTLGESIWIYSDTTFTDLSIPVIINGSRYHDQGEQQIYMWDGDYVISCMFASVNIYGEKFGKTRVDETLIWDHAASKQLQAVEGLKLLWRHDENTILVDTGSGSSDMQRTWISERLIRLLYRDTTRRDVLERLIISEKKWWIVIAPNLTNIYGTTPNNILPFPPENFLNIWQSITPEQARELIDLGKEATLDAQ